MIRYALALSRDRTVGEICQAKVKKSWNHTSDGDSKKYLDLSFVKIISFLKSSSTF